MLNFLRPSRYHGIILILFFMTVAATFILLRHGIREYRSSMLISDIEISDSIPNLSLTNTSGEQLRLKNLISTHHSTWIYFFSPNCKACGVLEDQVVSRVSENLIHVSFAPVSFLSAYKKKTEIIAPLFSLHSKYARLIGVSTVPFLIRVDRNGNIIERESNYKLVSKRLIEISEFGKHSFYNCTELK